VRLLEQRDLGAVHPGRGVGLPGSGISDGLRTITNPDARYFGKWVIR
jgi:hypothetical protein